MPKLSAAVAVSPPPMMVVAPLLVASTTAAATALVPVAKASNSNTPTGPFHTMVLDFLITSVNLAQDLGPQSSPSKLSGMPLSSVAAPTVASGANLSAVT